MHLDPLPKSPPQRDDPFMSTNHASEFIHKFCIVHQRVDDSSKKIVEAKNIH